MASEPPIPYSELLEQVPADEAEDIERVLELIRRSLGENYRASGVRRRDVHVKAHGSAAGNFRVLDALPEELAQGCFARPAVYSAFVRFSNASPVPLPDAVPDGRGLAMQIVGIDGDFLAETGTPPAQDFVMANHPVFLARDVKDYLRLQAARLETGRHPLKGAFLAVTNHRWNPLAWKWRELCSAAQVAFQLPRHPAMFTYYSMVPIRYGRYVAKYRVRPAANSPRIPLLPTAIRSGLQRDVLSALLADSLCRRTLEFEFQVQLRTSLDRMPIEDATVEWPETTSPYRTVGRLSLPVQEITARAEEGEQRCFSVWNALSEHRPLGGMNRARRRAYEVSAAWRHPSLVLPVAD